MQEEARTRPQSAAPTKCAACNRPLELNLFCDGCHTLYPADRLNYFELLALPPQYDLDPAEVRRAYLNLARVTHPDRFPGAPAEVAGLSLRLSAQINRAQQVLLDPVLRAEYMLELAGGSSAAQDKSVPPEVLSATLLLREEIDEARAAGDTAALAAIAARIRAERERRLASMAALARQLPGDEALRHALRVALNVLKYDERLSQAVSGALEAQGVQK